MYTKNLVTQFVGVVSLFISLSVLSAPVSVDLTTGEWTVTAFDTSGTDWSGSTLIFESQVESGDDWILGGYFYWVSDAGDFGKENFNGSLFPDRSLHLVGYEHVPPISGIILGEYFAELAPSNNDIVDGTWQAGVPYIPTDGWTATRVVPIPAAAWLFGSALLGLVGIARKKAA